MKITKSNEYVTTMLLLEMLILVLVVILYQITQISDRAISLIFLKFPYM